MEQIQGGLDVGGGTGNGTGRRRKANGADKEQGRKDSDGQEAAINLTELKKGMPKAIKLEKDLADAKADASAFYKKFAKACGLNTAQLKKAAKSYADEDVEAQQRKAEQMTLIFENCG